MLLVSLRYRVVAFSVRIARHTHTHTQTDKPSTVTLAVDVYRGGRAVLADLVGNGPISAAEGHAFACILVYLASPSLQNLWFCLTNQNLLPPPMIYMYIREAQV